MSSKQVCFSTIEIIEFPIILGDNPSVTAGPPLTISWEPQYRIELDLEVFERCREPCRRSDHDLIVDPYTREDVLIRAGFGTNQLAKFWIDPEIEVEEPLLMLSPETKRRRRKSLMKRTNKQRLLEIRLQEHELEEKLQRIREMLLKGSSRDLISTPCA